MAQRGGLNSVLILISALLCSFSISHASAAPISVLSFNLHGYHPTGEPERWLENRDGSRTATDSYLFFFAHQELERGHRVRLDRLARDLRQMSPDILFLQEVAAGSGETPKDCAAFYKKPANRNDDRFELNSVLRLANRLPDTYRAALACRGNVGWWTNQDTFKDQRVIRYTGPQNTRPEVVFDFGANPYPGGLIVEGLAMLVKAPLAIADEQRWTIPTSIAGDNGFVQAAAILLNGKRADSPWVIAVNVHGARKLKHFEQAVQIRRKISEYLSSLRLPGPFAGTIVGGDFNAQLSPDVSTVPWEMELSGRRYLSWPLEAAQLKTLKNELIKYNFNEKVDADASVRDPAEAEWRAEHAIENLLAFSREWNAIPGYTWGLQESLAFAQRRSLCKLPVGPEKWDASCSLKSRIDLIFTNTEMAVQNSYVVYSKNNWKSLQSLSDHPGLWAEFLPDSQR